mgnify:FL=1
MTTGLGTDDRGLSESTGVAILVGIPILVTASVGLNVLVVGEQDTGPPSANFTYDYIEQSRALLVTHSRGDELEAGKVHFVALDRDVTWAQLSGTNNTTAVEPGDLVQLSERNAFGSPVSSSTQVEILYEYEGNRTKLDEWPTGNS